MLSLAQKLPEPLRFAVVGAIGFVVDGAVLSAILFFAPTAVLAARVPSFLVAATCTWWLHRVFTFRAGGGPGSLLRQWFAFLVTNGLGNSVNVLLYGILVTTAAWPPLAALATASIVAAVLNYLAARRFVFRRSDTVD